MPLPLRISYRGKSSQGTKRTLTGRIPEGLNEFEKNRKIEAEKEKKQDEHPQAEGRWMLVCMDTNAKAMCVLFDRADHILAVLQRRGARALAERAQECAPIRVAYLSADILHRAGRIRKQRHGVGDADVVEHV